MVVMMAHDGMGLPSGSLHTDHSSAKGLPTRMTTRMGPLRAAGILTFVESVREHEASPTPQRVAERGPFGHRLRPAWMHNLQMILATCAGCWYRGVMIEREITRRLTTLFEQYPFVTVTGPRQSGKTTLCRSAFPNLEYANLEAPD